MANWEDSTTTMRGLRPLGTHETLPMASPPADADGDGLLALLRERWKLIAAITLVTVLAALAYVVTAQRVYQAEADLLVTPVSRNDEALSGLGLLRESSDPTREIETVARLVDTLAVERAASEIVPAELRDDFIDVQALPVAQSNIVSIVVQATDAEAAAAWANAYSEAFIEVRTLTLRERAASAIAGLEARLETTNNQAVQDQLALQLSQLERIRGGTDPTIDLETRASPPQSPISPRPSLSLAGGLIFGLLFGVGVAFALRKLDPRLQRESQLASAFPLPVLARIPAADALVNGRKGRGRSGSRVVSPAAVEASWPLRALLGAPRGHTGARGALAITSADSGEEPTTVAFNLAYSLAASGEEVILVETDLRRPSVARALGLTATSTTADVLVGLTSLDDALVSSPRFPSSLQVLMADGGGNADAVPQEDFVLHVPRLLEEARNRAKYVIVDMPPLAETIDALAVADSVDEVVMVVRMGHTRVARLAGLRDLLLHHGQPAGFAVIGR